MRYQFAKKASKWAGTWSKRWRLINCQQFRWTPGMVQLSVEWYIGFAEESPDSNRHQVSECCECNSLARLRSSHFQPFSIHQPLASESREKNKAIFVNWFFILSTAWTKKNLINGQNHDENNSNYDEINCEYCCNIFHQMKNLKTKTERKWYVGLCLNLDNR